MFKTIRMSALLLGLVAGNAANAADLPVKAPPSAPVDAGGFYFVGDGWYQSMRLPLVDLGHTLLVFPPVGPQNVNTGPLAVFRPRVSGGGGDAALGYRFAPGLFPTAFGSDVRVEVGGSYFVGTQDQSSFVASLSTPGLPGTIAFQHLDGRVSFFLICGNDPCPTGTSLHTDYRTWRVHAKAASDFKVGSFTLTPSLKIFGGESRNQQSLLQVTNFTTIVIAPVTLVETATETSRDIGSMFGLKAKVDLNQWVAVAAGGEIGFADRSISLSAADSNSGSIPAFYTTNRSVTPLLANAEAGLIFKPNAQWLVRLFGGVNYDSHVAGVAAPTYTGVLGAVNGVTSSTPTTIRTSAEVGYYGGAGFAVKW